MQNRYVFLLVISLFSLSVKGQYKISGYLNTGGKEKTVYLSLLQFNEEVAIYPEQILISTRTDSTGYFELSGKLLSQESKLYRIHANRENDAAGYEFNEEGPRKNYHNFIFSNSDSIFFPGGVDIWFGSPQNTNKADAQWRNSMIYELKLTEEFRETKNSDAILQAETGFLHAYKQYCNDSLSDVLVKLLAYSHIKRNVSIVYGDYEDDPGFYNKLLKELDEYYSGASYYRQFQEEISKLSASLYQRKLIVYRNVSWTLAILTLFLAAIVVLQQRKIRREKAKKDIAKELILTAQETKVAELICAGKSNKEIADHLFISLSTVKSHIGNINSKLHVDKRQELIQILKNHTRY